MSPSGTPNGQLRRCDTGSGPIAAKVTESLAHGAPEQKPSMQTPQGTRPSLLHASQQSEVWVQPDVKSGTQPGTTQMPVASGFAC